MKWDNICISDVSYQLLNVGTFAGIQKVILKEKKKVLNRKAKCFTC